jgi:heparan-alpha-glucosaminide N-acetyltransferase
MNIARNDAAASAPAGDRLVSLDAYRGFTMLAMASAGMGMAHLRNDPRWGTLADQFEHREWLGCTFWDLIQPSFMFIVGVAMSISYAKRQDEGQSWWGQWGHAILRAALLCLIGFVLDGRIQFIRVLQQIAIGYLIVFPFVPLGPWMQGIVALFLLGGHTAAYQIYGHSLGVDPWLREQNFGHSIDLWLRDHFYLAPPAWNYVTFNAISSAATILFGVLAGELLRSGAGTAKKLLVLTLVGLGALVLGWSLSGGDAWAPISFSTAVPMVKRLWTSSFAIFAAGWTCLMLAAFYLIIDIWRFRTWSFPFVVVGMNSIAMYTAASLAGGHLRDLIKVSVVPFFLPGSIATSYAADPKWETVALYHPNWALALPVLVNCGALFVLWLFCYALYRQRFFFKL